MCSLDAAQRGLDVAMDVLASHLPFLKRLMTFHINVTSVQKICLQLLLQLSSHSAAMAASTSAECSSCVAKVMQAHAGDERIQSDCYLLLGTLAEQRVLAETPWFCEPLVSTVLHHCLAEMRKAPSSLELQDDGLYLLACFAMHSAASVEAILSANGLDVVKQAMQRFTDVEDVQDSGCRAISALARSSANVVKRLLAANIVELLIASMVGHPSNANVQVRR